MLTRKEKAWLRNREKWLKKIDPWGNRIFSLSCKNCSYFKHDGNGTPYCLGLEEAWVYEGNFDCWLIPSRELLLEAAAFESRVACKLALAPTRIEPPCDWGQSDMCYIECGSIWLDCREARLKWARLKVEEELDANGKREVLA